MSKISTPEGNIDGIQGCVVRWVGENKCECKVDRYCRYAVPFLNVKYCLHPEAAKIREEGEPPRA